MKLQTLRLALVFAILGLTIGATAVFAQDPDYRIVPITCADAGTGIGTDTFGVHSQATYCFDGAGPTRGGFVEDELPPKPPTGVFDFRFTDHRTPGCMGTGQRLHLQNDGQADTFKIEFQASDAGYPFTFTWPSGLSSDWSSLMMVDAFTGGLIFSANMLNVTTAIITNPPGLNTLYIIGTSEPVDVRREGDLVPQRFDLEQNYPNPFNPSTTIKFAIEKSAFADVAIYNVIGQKVKTLAAETMAPGFYTTTWNGTDDNGQAVTTGVYFVRMILPGQPSQSTRLTLLR